MVTKENRLIKQLAPHAKKALLITLILILFQTMMWEKKGTTKPIIQGIWVVRTTLASRESVFAMLKEVEKANLTDILVQVNMSGYAYYQSSRLPPAVTDFDPLQLLLQEAHQKDLKVHAWINAFTVGPLGLNQTNPNHVLYQHPEWSTVDIKGISVLEYPKSRASEALPTQYLEPGLKEVQDWVIQNCLEVVENYPVDGIHLDFLRYPGKDFGYHPEVVREFQEEYGSLSQTLILDEKRVETGPSKTMHLGSSLEFDEFREKQITRIIKEVYVGTKKLRPDLLVSAAVYPDPQEAVDDKFQNWFMWLDENLIDFVVPMVYSSDHTIFLDALAKISEKEVDLEKVVVGLGPYQDTLGGTISKIETVKEEGYGGFVLFSYDAIKESGFLELLNLENK
ncbi:MAG: family 10 glycosylhydrolase [Firmicutes bacterium]|nr:family 10 glycosylhydrolase [Bacillota bacterium]